MIRSMRRTGRDGASQRLTPGARTVARMKAEREGLECPN
jgi:hypothetical protein